MLYSLISEDASIAAAIYSMVFSPVIYGVVAGKILVQTINQGKIDPKDKKEVRYGSV